MSEQLSKLQELYTQLEAELPDHLKAYVKLEADESHACINIVFNDMGELGKENFKQLRSLLEENYSAAFVNPVFPQKPYYTVQSKPVVALPSKDDVEQALRDSLIKKAYALNLGIPDDNLQSMPLGKLETVVKVASKVSPETEQKKTVPATPTKQPSPMQILKARFCELCQDNATDKCNFELCLRILGVFEVQSQTDVLEKINRSLDNVQRQLSQIPSVSQHVQAVSPAPAVAASVQASPAAQPSQKVERNTRPTEGHKEGDVVWIYAENRAGERYEKALEKDNRRSNDYFELRGQIVERVNDGKKGLELNGKWLWLSDRDDYIGRKAAKEFPKGGRR
jgi:hypothetical protein